MTSTQQRPGDPAREHLAREQRSRKRSNPWRCLSRLRFGAYAIVALLLLEVLEGLLCEIMPPVALDAACPTIGPWLSWMAMGVIVMSAIACVHQWWHDFYKRQRKASRRAVR